jgi:predicted permease
MTRHRVLLSRIRALFGARQLDRDLDDELRTHIEMETEANLSRGMSPREARRAALIEFGGLAQTAEAYRDGRGLQWLETLFQDIRFAARGFRKAPGFTAVAILSLALGIGVNTVIFSMVNMALLRPLPVEDPGRLAILSMQQQGSIITPVFSYPDYRDLREQAASAFSDILAYRTGLDGLSVNGHADRIVTHYVTGNYFTLLGVKPAAGRLILPSESEADGAGPVVVLSYSYWKTRFGGDPSIVGKTVLLNGHPATIVGIAAKQFHGVQAMLDVQGYLPLSLDFPGGIQNNRSLRYIYLLARLRTGVKLEQAQTALNVVAGRLAHAYPKELGGLTLRARPETLARIPGAEDTLTATAALFLAMAALVLLLACVNLANLVMIRATVRRKEIAMRAALGGSRGRLIRQLLTENILLAICGGILGLLFGAWTSAALGTMSLQGVPLYLDFSFDWRVFAYAFAATITSGLMLGILPALRGSRADVTAVSRESVRFSPGRQRIRSVLVMAQIAGSLMLLVLAGLFSRSLQNARRLDLGFDPRNVVNLSVDPNEVGYDDARGRQFFKDVLRRVRALPGVESASLACCGPMGAVPMLQQVQIEGYTPPAGQSGPTIFYNHVSADFFQTLRIPIVRGRAFTEADSPKAPDVAIVNQTMAKLYWPGGDPIGRKFQFASFPGHWFQVAGVAKDGKYVDIAEPPMPYFYLPLDQNYFAYQTLRIRSSVPADVVIAEARKAIASTEPGLPVFGEETMLRQLEGAKGFLSSRLPAWVATTVGILSLVLALVGLYGVVSYSAVQQTHEIGVRMALGANAREIRKLVLGRGLIVVCAGVVAGILFSLAAAPLVRGFLCGVSATDPATIVSVSILLAFVTLLACYIPAKRAMGVDPVVALRHE